ncbi:cytadherence high molecular weight protein 1-like [Anastrepha obliqua]|uniref:cytadherence high molecular weight protein 1-like n=1 Tax=Anastrepha obliqua TaxID=95512 RepID=UPI0024094AC3|nr:cytadherence high molecular weight protein 1-like [Anastrepha obliqua]
MWKLALLLVCLSGCCLAGPLHGVKRNVPIVLQEEEVEAERPAPEPLAPEYPEMPSTLTLPSNATSIRTDITDNFSCDDKVYGYYADVENDCQIFHVCLPVTYADGKENTFRWSFICPEETVFSQDSFTCMRREDMAITCEDSVNYYELNRNFGNTEEQSANSNNMPDTEEQAEAQQPEPVKPTQQEVQQAAAPQEEPQTAAAPAQAAKPMKVKPAQVQKPNRRKPQPKPQQYQGIHPTNKLPSIMPLRKMPNVGPIAPVNIPAEVVSVHEIKDEVKSVPPRYKKRPAVTYSTEKEVVEVPAPPFKVEVVHTLSNPESLKRKRPTFAHKNNVVVNKVPEDVPVIESVPVTVSVEPVVPAVKLESNSGSAPLPVAINEPVAQTAEELPVIVEPVQDPVDAEPQASEIEEHIVEPENTLKAIVEPQIVNRDDTSNAKDDIAAPIEVAVPVIVEEAENVAPILDETVKNDELAAEEISKVEEPVAEEVTKIEEPVEAEKAHIVETQKEEQSAKPIEVVEEVPALSSEPLESAPEEEKLQEIIKPQISVEMPAQTEEQSLLGEPAEIVDQLGYASEPVALDAAPEVIAPIENNDELLPALPSLEEMEAQKPVDAIETMPATQEMEQQDPIVQQAFEEKGDHLQTVGGFKPVDPELAAEAEALISDFINTLKSDHPNIKPSLPVPIEEEAPTTSAESEDVKVETEELQQTDEKNEESQSNHEETQVAVEADTSSLKTIAAEQPAAVEPENEPVVSENEPIPVVEKESNISPLLKFPISNSFPSDMYHIPVTVIQTPYEEVQNIKSAEITPVEEQAPAQEEKQEETKFLPEETALAQSEITEEQKVEDPSTAEAQSEPIAQVAETEAVENQPEAAHPDLSEAVESQPEIEQPAAPMAFRPISIDDIVELVKERLDQIPANEKGAPMELVMEPDNADKPVELKFSLQKGSAPQEESADQTPAEDIIFPIYHRVSEPESSNIQAQETVAVDESNAIVTDLKTLPLQAETVQTAVAPVVESIDQAVQTDDEELGANVAKTAANTETETKSAPVTDIREPDSSATVEIAESDVPAKTETSEAEDSAKSNRALRSRSLTKAKLDPRKRRFLFRSDAS